ncbi:pyridoxal-phosphate dependent enzyme [Clostridiales bacterium]|nr:pyridoxal-phosphate dependent enzyme [Clostridiales bacterium]
MSISCKKVPFLNLPTPLEYLPNVSRDLGINLYLKRDDLTGLGMGGNKLRKLEYFLYDAQQQEATMLLTVGGAQTNHGRLTAAIAAKYGLKCAIVAIDDYPGEISANILLDRILGADVILKEDDRTRSLETQSYETAMAVKERYEAQGETVYYIPMGGSDELGVLGYYDCAQELTIQAAEMGISDSRVITAVGSMGTYMGLFCGLKDIDSPLALTGTMVMPYEESVRAFAKDYFDRIKERYQLEFDAEKSDFHIDEDYIYGGYNNEVPEVREAIYHMARQEAILLDPCYTGKAFNAISQMVCDRKIERGETIIFIHTGGQPGLNTPHHRMEFEAELKDGIKIL